MNELIVDNFAGGGGASTGIELALGRSPDIAVNHDPEAVAMHTANHPATRHFCESVWTVDPVEACGGRPVGLAWFSPDCTFHSRARGGKPFRERDTAKRRRGLAWVVTRWARAVRPRVICLENVAEFEDWGPLLDDGTPCPERRGLTFKRWVAQLRNLGYAVEWRELRACDYGAPTTRKRLFLVARCDGQPIAWPAPTHAQGGGLWTKPWRTAAECIDWTIPCPSIFDRARPLADATLRRIARGIRRYVVDAAEPFIVPVSHAGDTRAHGLDEPLRTVTASSRSPFTIVAPTLIQTSYGEREGQAPRTLDLHQPLGTVVAGGVKHALVSAFLAKHYGGHEGSGASLRGPTDTVTTRDHHALVTSHLVKLRGECTGSATDEPVPTITASGTHIGEVRAFLLKYYGTDGDPKLRDRLHTITTHDRFGLLVVAGERYQIVDIGMRMLTPRELFRAQGFPDSYRIELDVDGRPLTRTAQIRMCGNSVAPPVAAALVRANCTETRKEIAA